MAILMPVTTLRNEILFYDFAVSETSFEAHQNDSGQWTNLLADFFMTRGMDVMQLETTVSPYFIVLYDK
jgi:hypothetical protein